VTYELDGALQALFPTRARRAILVALFGPGACAASKSDLARRSGLTQRAISVEVDALERCGLARVEALGTAHVVRANAAHPVARSLKDLLARATESPEPIRPLEAVRKALAALGAPLPEAPASTPAEREGALVAGLEAARSDAEVLRVLPAVVARHASDIDWARLLDLARAAKLKAELGFVLELAADLATLPWLRDVAAPLHDGRRRVLHWLPDAAGEAERALADRHPQALAARWGFRVNLTEDAFRAALLATPLDLAGERPAPSPRDAVTEALRAIDASDAAPESVTLLGDAALALRHGLAPSLPSLDLFPHLEPAARAALAPVLERHPFLESREPAPEALSCAPYCWKERRVPWTVPGLARVRVLLPEPHDWAILRAARALATDLDAVEAHHRRAPLRLGILVVRYLEAVGDSAEVESRLRPGFLAVVERLFGSRGHDRVRAGLPREGPQGTAPGPPVR
jgi:hypothetical protein